MEDFPYFQLPDRLLGWYRQNKRDLPWRADQDPYHVWLSEIMLQQTRVEAVKAYYTRFLQALPTIGALAQADDELLHKLWEGLGYYTRVRNLKKAAQQIVTQYGGQFPRTHDEILRLAGIGPYTAGAIGSICFDLPTPAVDGNVMRVITRLTARADPIDLPATRKDITQKLSSVYPAGACGDFTQSLMELGATVCGPNGAPACLLCPLSDLCRARQAGQQTLYPVKSAKKARRIEPRTVYLLRCDGRIALQKRPSRGLLAGLWELPNELGACSAQQALERAAQMQLSPYELVKSVHAVHIFTHIEWQMCCYEILCRTASDAFTWVYPQALQQAYALPTAFRIFLKEELE
ncbi:MAG: A/G-specific adenine glycosylase [Clostridiales bacterium]|nr:A/G-specific adenine glycosylase [Clostridiales bacterium]